MGDPNQPLGMIVGRPNGRRGVGRLGGFGGGGGSGGSGGGGGGGGHPRRGGDRDSGGRLTGIPIRRIRDQGTSDRDVIPHTQALITNPSGILSQLPHWYSIVDGTLHSATNPAPISITSQSPDPPQNTTRSNAITTSIHTLPIELLISIFGLCRQAEAHNWSLSYGWITLIHVCRRWRQCIVEFSSSLDLIIRCTTRTVRTIVLLSHLPSFLIALEYTSGANSYPSEDTTEDSVTSLLSAYADSRLCSIELNAPEATLSKFAGTMDRPALSLRYLSLRLQHSPSGIDGLTLPGAFLDGNAPDLRHISMRGVFLPSLTKLLSSTQRLHSLSLQIPKIALITPDELLISLANLTRLAYHSLEFPIVTSRRSRSGQSRSVPASQKVAFLPSLVQCVYYGETHNLEALVAGIDMPSVDSLKIKVFHRLTFAIPHLSDLIAGTALLGQGSVARVDFTRSSGELHVYPRIEDAQSLSSKGVHLVVSGYQFDWRVHSMVRLCRALALGLRNVRSLFLRHHLKQLKLKRREEVEPLLWTTLLAGFERTRTLWVSKALVPELGHALDPGVMEGSAGYLMPTLDAVVAPPDEVSRSLLSTVSNAFGPLHAARHAISLTFVNTFN